MSEVEDATPIEQEMMNKVCPILVDGKGCLGPSCVCWTEVERIVLGQAEVQCSHLGWSRKVECT